MRIKSIKINNILSIEDAYVEFDDSGLMLVQGWNHDVGRANGAGKTAIFNALTFALFDKLPRKVTATEILRRGSKSGSAEVVLEVGMSRYRVLRKRPKGVQFFKESEELAVTQDRWEKIIGLTYNQFILAVYAAQGGAGRFFSINDADKKQFLLQLLSLEEFSSCKTIADAKVRLLENEFTKLRSKEQSVAAKIDAYQESLVDENVIEHAINEGNKALVVLHSLLQEAQSILRPDLSKYLKLEEDVAGKKLEFAKARDKRERLHDQYKKLTHALSVGHVYADRCGACGSVIDTTASKAMHEKELEQHRLDRDQVQRELTDIDTFLSRERGVVELSKKIRERKMADSTDYDAAQLRAHDVQTKIALRSRDIKELNLKLQNNSDLQSKIKDLCAESQKLTSAGDMILRDIELYKTVAAMYSPTGAQAYILDSVIDSFNERVHEYVDYLWSNMTYELKSYKETVRGDVTAKFSEHLMMDGKPISIGSLSGGEFRALSLCVDFALVDVMERQFGISLSPIILDEPFDGLDSTGREFIVELLEKFSTNRQVVVIDHASEIASSFANIIKVEKRNGISTIYKTT
jgi:DNA repair exonuclease SbcCD ATPase subunit